MLEGIVLTTFALAILGCALTGQSVIWALVFGFSFSRVMVSIEDIVYET